MLNDESVSRIAAVVSGRKAILAVVHAEEAEGINRIPAVMAEALETRLRGVGALRMDTEIVQANRAGHTGATGWARIAQPALFDGAIETGAQYVIVDDFIGQGGTIANLRGHIEYNGGRVILDTGLTGQGYSAKLFLSRVTLSTLRAKHGSELEDWFHKTFGYGLDRLTESEARYLTRAESLDTIRNRLAQARSQANR